MGLLSLCCFWDLKFVGVYVPSALIDCYKRFVDNFSQPRSTFSLKH